MDKIYRIGNGYDVHAFAEGLPLWVCGVRVDHSKGCVAHSDGDAPLHALCDALLGALALGDIGKHFPDSADEYKGIDSKVLLDKVHDLVIRHGFYLVNADITIALQAPKLAHLIDDMRETVAGVFCCDVSQISVKATTTERLGFVGREEGIEAWATVLLCS